MLLYGLRLCAWIFAQIGRSWNRKEGQGERFSITPVSPEIRDIDYLEK